MIGLAVFFISINIANAQDILYLQCQNSNQLIDNRLNNIDDEMRNPDKWKPGKNEAFYFVPFGMDWEEVDKVCYAYQAYIEVGSYNRVVPYTDEVECTNGIFGSGDYTLRDSWGGYFMGNIENTYIPLTESCNIRMNFKVITDTAHKVEWSKKRTCKQAKKHFLNLIIDSEYGKEKKYREWQRMKCKEISKIIFEKKTGLSTEVLIQTLAKDVIQ